MKKIVLTTVLAANLLLAKCDINILCPKDRYLGFEPKDMVTLYEMGVWDRIQFKNGQKNYPIDEFTISDKRPDIFINDIVKSILIESQILGSVQHAGLMSGRVNAMSTLAQRYGDVIISKDFLDINNKYTASSSWGVVYQSYYDQIFPLKGKYNKKSLIDIWTAIIYYTQEKPSENQPQFIKIANENKVFRFFVIHNALKFIDIPTILIAKQIKDPVLRAAAIKVILSPSQREEILKKSKISKKIKRDLEEIFKEI